VPFDERTAVGYSVGLVVDDAGTEKDFLVNDLAALFVARYKNALPTVITTNLSTVEFGERYGMRFVDRMREVGKFLVVSNDASDSLRGGT
jgi:DNA replication protein DnaC